MYDVFWGGNAVCLYIKLVLVEYFFMERFIFAVLIYSVKINLLVVVS